MECKIQVLKGIGTDVPKIVSLPVLILMLFAWVVGGLRTTPSAYAASVTPTFVEGNPTCSDLAPAGKSWLELKVEPVTSGVYSDGTLSINLTVSGSSISWTSNIGLDAVFVKGGPNGNLYTYDPPTESKGDTNLTAPINPSNGQPFGLSHVSFCYDIELDVSKTATTTFTRTYQWNILKSVTPSTLNMFTGDTGEVKYTVAVTKTGYVDSGWKVTGTITIKNPHPSAAATVTGVTDTITGGINATVACGVTFPYTLASGGTLNCTYNADLPDGTDRTNTATATTSGVVGGGSGTAAVKFGSPTTEVNKTINVDDTLKGSLGAFSDSGSVSYTRTFACDADKGTKNNTATIKETGQSSSASVTVNCYALAVTKTADEQLTRTWKWTIAKTGDQKELTLSIGQQYTVNYKVLVDATSADSGWKVTGAIAVKNPAPIPATITSVADVVSPSINGTVTCGVTFPYTLAANGTLNCTYSADLPDATTRTNTATATLQNYDYKSDGTKTATGTTKFTGTAAVNFTGAKVNDVDECIDVTDTYAGNLGKVCAGVDTLPKTFTYSRTIGNYADCGDRNVDNTAAFKTNDTAATGSSSWRIIVHVPCLGCTLTQGYWKTHSEFGPAPYDNTWAKLPSGASTIFFLSGKTWYQVFWTAPAGNAYYNLAHQYEAAYLNKLDGTTVPASVQQALDSAKTIFDTYTPAQVDAFTGKQRNDVLALAKILDDYNNGLKGVPHCSEQNS